MNQPHPGPTPTPGPRPVPGPRPAPGQGPNAADLDNPSANAVDPDEIRRQVAELLDQADEVAADVDQPADSESLAQLARQAALLEQAHTLLTDALEKVDRV